MGKTYVRKRGRGGHIEVEQVPLIDSPLLVRMLIIVHLSEQCRLPEQRAELYMKAVNAGRVISESRTRQHDLKIAAIVKEMRRFLDHANVLYFWVTGAGWWAKMRVYAYFGSPFHFAQSSQQ